MPDGPQKPPYRVYRSGSPGSEEPARSGRPGTLEPEPPAYKRYRSGPRGLRALLRGDDGDGLPPSERPRRQGEPRPGRRITPRRVIVGVLLAIVAWLLLSLVLFLISAQINEQPIPSSTQAALSPGGNMLTSTDTVLVIGTDQRPRTGPGSKEPGSNYSDAGSRSDTLMLWRVGGGTSRRLSIPRDTEAQIPGHGTAKINAAYAYGGSALTVKTVEAFTGVKINHVIIVNLANFPKFIDALGGITVKTDRVCSTISGGTANGGFTLNLSPGTHNLSGEQALVLARTRENRCNPSENDLTREGRQQAILNAIKSRLTSPSTFFRLPWASWAAPPTLRTDMGGFTLLTLFAAAEIGGSAPVHVLKPSGYVTLPDGESALSVTPGAVRQAVQQLLNG